MQFDGPFIVSQGAANVFNRERGAAWLEKNEAGDTIAVWHQCPCPCKGNRRLSVVPAESPSWAYSVGEDGKLTLSPSIQDIGNCNSHYFIVNGMVEWV